MLVIVWLLLLLLISESKDDEIEIAILKNTQKVQPTRGIYLKSNTVELSLSSIRFCFLFFCMDQLCKCIDYSVYICDDNDITIVKRTK